ncbi:MAG: hypothetical protein J7K89_02580 [Candidatus Cloacimonetes bacterium]|nr:hypothetical protein [Candidatus Cloacimonadota bacterium]
MKSDTIAKIIVLLITLVLWLHLTLTKQQSTDIDLPVVLQDLPADLVYDNSEPLTIPVTLKGSGFDLMITMLSDHFFLVPAGHMTYGRNKITVNQGDLIVPEIVSLDIAYGEEGNEKTIFLDRIISKKRGLELEYASTKDEEYFIKNRVDVSNHTVIITGPEKVVSQIARVKTIPLSRKMVDKNKLTVNLVQPSQLVSLDKSQVTLLVITSKQINRTFSLIPVDYPHNMNISVIPQKVSLMVRGPEEIVNKMTAGSIKATLNMSQMWINNQGTVTFDVPAGVKIIEYTPKKLQIQKNEQNISL